MLRLMICGIAAALVLTSPARAERWRVATEKDDAAPYVLMFIDEASVSRSGDTATGWVMTVLEPDASGGRDWDHSVILRDIDCSGARSRMAHTKFFVGDSLIEDNPRPGDWKAINPGTLLDDVAQVMCGRETYMTEVVRDPVAISREYFATLKDK